MVDWWPNPPTLDQAFTTDGRGLIFSGSDRSSGEETKVRMLGELVMCGVNLIDDLFSPLHTLPLSGHVKND